LFRHHFGFQIMIAQSHLIRTSRRPYACVRQRERESVCACERERERGREREGDREREREKKSEREGKSRNREKDMTEARDNCAREKEPKSDTKILFLAPR